MWGDSRIGLIKSVTENICLKTYESFLEQSASFQLPTLNSLHGMWKSADAAAHDLIFVEIDGKCQSVAEKVNYFMTTSTFPLRPVEV